MDFNKFVDWAFLGVLSSGIGWTTVFLGRISKSITSLNIKMSTIIEKTAWHERELNEHGHRLSLLEKKRRE